MAFPDGCVEVVVAGTELVQNTVEKLTKVFLENSRFWGHRGLLHFIYFIGFIHVFWIILSETFLFIRWNTLWSENMDIIDFDGNN